MLAARSSAALLRPSRPAPAFKPASAARPVRAVAPLARKAQVVVCAAAAETVEAPVAEVTGPKGGVAHHSFQRGSVHKVRRILDVLRGRSYEEALILCEYMPYVACEKIIKVLMSAAANAKHNAGASKAKLYVKECFADGGPNLKRANPVSKGRAFKILKPTFHVTIRVEERA